MDFVTKEKRSKIMASIRSKNTRPEIIVRKLLHKMGYRFKLHNKKLPGKPDICLPKYKTIIFVHGCFWHHHTNCKEGRFPTSNTSFWNQKIQKNIERDKTNQKALKGMGWNILTLWECEVKNSASLEKTITLYLPKA